MNNVFLSYSHKDEEFLRELETHLSPLKRKGLINSWHDRDIGAGEELHDKIGNHLEEDSIIILLISANYISSTYCCEKEMPRAMERHERGDAIVIPVIVRPCDWQQLPFARLKATPTDGKAVSTFGNRDEAYVEIIQEVRSALSRLNEMNDSIMGEEVQQYQVISAPQVEEVYSKNLSTKKEFTDYDKEEYLRKTYDYIATYFCNSLIKLEEYNQHIRIRFQKIDNNTFSASIYTNGSESVRWKVVYGGYNNRLLGGIRFSFNPLFDDNSFNNILNVEDDGYSMFLSFSMPLNYFGNHQQNKDKKKMNPETAAEALWALFIEQLQ